MKRIIIVAFFCLFGFFLYLYFNQQSPFKHYNATNYKIGNKYYKLYLADSIEKKRKGLSDVAYLGRSEGMLFTFEQPGYFGFWMKDMHFSIDILLLNNLVVVDILQNLSPASYPNTFKGKVPYSQVIELNAGEVSSSGVQIGDTIEVL